MRVDQLKSTEICRYNFSGNQQKEVIKLLGDKISMSDALMVTVFSMLIVFSALLAINFILKGFKVFLYKEKKDNATKVKKETQKQTTASKEQIINQDNNEEELVAVLTAALAASLSRPASDIRIRKITRINQSSSIWSRAGRLEQMN